MLEQPINPVINTLQSESSFNSELVGGLTNQSMTSDIRDTKLISLIRNLERFCQEVCQNKLLWTPEVLEFFRVPPNLVGKFEKEREKNQRER